MFSQDAIDTLCLKNIDDARILGVQMIEKQGIPPEGKLPWVSDTSTGDGRSDNVSKGKTVHSELQIRNKMEAPSSNKTKEMEK